MIRQLNMIERLKHSMVLIILVIIVGCSGEFENNKTYFGGKIINPKTNYVVLFDNEVVFDTIYLNRDNSFLTEINLKNGGLYYFKHGNEHQYIYIEPKDSVLVRLNTWDFDESLVFSGKGAERNNLLIDIFLENERDEKFFRTNRLYDLFPGEFRQKVDSIEELRIAMWKDFDIKNPEDSESFKNILKIALTYPLYAKVESYPMAHNAMSKNAEHEVVNRTFYTHRDNIDLHNDSIMYFYAYRNLMMSHLYNKVNTAGHHHESNEFTVSLLKTIANEVKNERTRNAILRQTVVGHFYQKSSCDVNNEAFDTYFQLSSNEDDKDQVKKLWNDSKIIHAGKKLHDFHITDYNNMDRSIKSIVKGKNAVIYFWNPEYTSRDFIAKRITFLARKHPNVEFVGIQLNGNGKDRIKQLDIKSQYYVTTNSEANKFLTSQMPRTLLINNKGTIINGYASLNSRNIYDQIEKLAKN